MSFFRFHNDLRWEGQVHEQLVGLNGKAYACPISMRIWASCVGL